MTEDEAKTKWCPMVHVRYLGTIAPKGEEERAMEVSERKERLSKCLASSCMMWRWDSENEEGCNQEGGQASCFMKIRCRDCEYMTVTPKMGHCGLAGVIK